ncbi:ArnT family glycosyltransferase [Nocardia jiangxiensis]|uniref:ArnT family glycosyltransferase n=1 Tax=Nocardia jiangxiensis TaxID=282685 RepID=A0ABW6S6W2_9NOCA
MTATTADTAVSESTSPPLVEQNPALGPARRWERIALVVLLLGTAAAYLWNITVNGMGNNFYAASAWAGSRSWKALLFGSLDPGNFITVDKPPVSQWVMGLSGQLFGFSSASMLIPEALMAVAAVALTYGAITRATDSRGAGLLAGAMLAVTPVVAMMFRFNNPDAAMVLLMTAAAYCTIRSLRWASMRWLMLAGVALGFAFLAKMLEGLMVLPALGLAYLVVAPTGLGRRIGHLLAAAVALVVSSGWYVLLTILWPADSRPYLAGSTNDTFMDLVLGYNGFARYLGKNHMGRKMLEMPAGYEFPHFHGGGPFGGGNGVERLFTGEIGFEISWLLPAAILAFVLVLISRGRAPRTDLVRGAALTFGLWLLIDGAAFAGMQGGMHAYYTLAIAPAIAGTVALGVLEMWRRRNSVLGRSGSAALILAGGVWGFVLLQRNSDWQPWLRWTILVVTILAAAGLALTAVPALSRRTHRRATAVLVAVGMIAALGGSTAYAAATLPQAHTGGGPSVGPAHKDEMPPAFAQMRHAFGMFMGGDDYPPQLIDMLRHTNTTWSAATERSGPAAGLELASRTSVIAIGGFTSEDPTPTLAQFQDMVRTHQLTYYIAPEVKLPDSWRKKPAHPATGNEPNQSAAQQDPDAALWHPVGNTDIFNWVSAHYAPQRMDGLVVFNLSAAPH